MSSPASSTASSAPTINAQPSVLLAEWSLQEEDALVLGVRSARRFCIYGAKVPVPHGQDAWCGEYAVHEHRADGAVLQHHLAQRGHHRSVMWISADATNTDEMADMVKPSAIPCLARKPRWKRESAAIPMRPDGGMYMFLKQFYVPASARIQAHFYGGFSLFLFATPQPDGEGLELALFGQEMSQQTAEDHYRLEEQIADFLAAPRDLAKVEALIRAGDKHFHEFVLDSPKSTQPVLETLLRHAKTQTFKSAVQKRIASIGLKPR